MDKIYAPWRSDYVSKASKKKDKDKIPQKNCVFCNYLKENKDEENLIIKRFKKSFIIMNKYPYNSGHIMVLPITHKKDLFDLTKQDREELIETVNIAIESVKKVFTPDGFNIGINMGSAGGGGIPCHLHVHIIPRWNGDTNFLASIGNTKVVCADFKDVYKKLKSALK